MAESRCAICGTGENVNRCRSCETTSYCSPKCQKLDWPLHKLLCGEFNDFKTTRPGDREESGVRIVSKLAILLGSEATNPKLIWVDVEEHESKQTEDGMIEKRSSVLTSISKYCAAPKVVETLKYGRNVEIWMNTCRVAGGATNKLLGILTDGYNYRYSPAYVEKVFLTGDLVITCKTGLACSPGQQGRAGVHVDASLADFRYALNHMVRKLGSNIFDSALYQNNFVLREAGAWTQIVRILNPVRYKQRARDSDLVYSPALVKNKPLDFYEEDDNTDIKTFFTEGTPHGCFETDQACQISREMKMPLLVTLEMRTDEIEATANDPPINSIADSDHPFSSLLIDVDPASEDWAIDSANIRSRVDAGFLLWLTREDKQSIDCQQVEAFVHYCQDILRPAMIRTAESSGGTLKQRKQVVAEYLHSDAFEIYFEAFRAAKILKGVQGWEDAKPPVRGVKGIRSDIHSNDGFASGLRLGWRGAGHKVI